MRDLRVGLAQISPALGRIDENLALHLEHIARAEAEGAAVVVFPELSLTGYQLLDQVAEVALAADDPRLARLARASRRIDVVAGFVEDAPGHRFHNVAAYWSRGSCVHLHRKVYLPTYGMFQEGRDLAPGQSLRAFATQWGPGGLAICEDLWHATTSWLLAQQGAEVIFVPSNGPTRGARPGRGITSLGVWADLLRVNAQFQTVFLVLVNRVGVEDGVVFGGGSTVVDPFGRVVASLPALDEELRVVELRAEVLRRARTAYPLLRDENLELTHRELDRIRRVRYELEEEEDAEEGAGEPPQARAKPADAGRARRTARPAKQ